MCDQLDEFYSFSGSLPYLYLYQVYQVFVSADKIWVMIDCILYQLAADCDTGIPRMQLSISACQSAATWETVQYHVSLVSIVTSVQTFAFSRLSHSFVAAGSSDCINC